MFKDIFSTGTNTIKKFLNLNERTNIERHMTYEIWILNLKNFSLFRLHRVISGLTHTHTHTTNLCCNIPAAVLADDQQVTTPVSFMFLCGHPSLLAMYSTQSKGAVAAWQWRESDW